MSQAGIVDIEGSHPQIPTMFVTNDGTAIPIANVLEILGTTVAAHSIPLETTGSGNTVTIVAQYASAAASSVATNAGFASFNSADFTVDANGFVTFMGTGAAETLTGNSGGTVSPTAGNINTVGTGSITIVGNPGTSTLTTELTGLTNHNVLVGAGTATITNVAPSTAGFVLTSNGASSDPSFQAPAASGITTIDGDSGSVTGTTIHLLAQTGSANCGSSVSFTASSATELDLIVTDANSNTIIGKNAGSGGGTPQQNTALGFNCFLATQTGGGNTTIGYNSSVNMGSGVRNTAAGAVALFSCQDGSDNSGFGQSALSSVTSGINNSGLGSNALSGINSGNYNIGVGFNGGSSLGLTSDSNICIGNVGGGTDSNVIRIGTQGSSSGQQNACFIAGIAGVTTTSSEMVTVNTVTGQLGNSPIPGVSVWTDEATSFSAAVSNGYFITGTATATLPASAAQGNTISFIVDTASILTIQTGTGQVIRIGTTVSATNGTATNNARGDSLTIVFRASDSAWISLGAPQGTWTVT